MDAHRFDRFTRRFGSLGKATPRRTLLHGATAIGATLVSTSIWTAGVEAKTLCRKDASKCKKKSKKCKPSFCLTAPLTIEARWSNPASDHDTYLFVPNESGFDFPFPFIEYSCNPTDCEEDVYPFICVSQDATGPGDEVTTVRKLLPGTYEYWIELEAPSPAGDLTILLRTANGRIVRTWTSPANASNSQVGWHVFDFNGATRGLISIDTLIATGLPDGAHNPSTFVCP